MSQNDPREGVERSESADVLAVLDSIEPRVHAWLDANANDFDTFTLRTDKKTEYYRKAFGEAGLFLYVLDSLGDQPAEMATPVLHEVIVEQVNDPKFTALVRREPRYFLRHAYPLVYTKKLGELTPENAAAIYDVLDDRSVWGFERTPHRMLDMWFFCRLFGFECDFGFESIVELCCLTHPPDPITATQQDTYALTHNLLYYHKFGIDEPIASARFDIEDVVIDLLLRYLYEDNADIVLELVMGGVLDGRLPVPLVSTIIDWLQTKVHPSGFVQAPRDPFPDEDTDAREWERHYHTTLVAGMAIPILQKYCYGDHVDTEQENEIEPISELLALGEIITAFHNYQLEEGARCLLDVADSPIVRRYPGVISRLVGYLREQQTDDGTFGYWTDEASLYEVVESDPEKFRELIAENSRVCTRAIREYDDLGFGDER